jgi:Tol biopolymer transport system component
MMVRRAGVTLGLLAAALAWAPAAEAAFPGANGRIVFEDVSDGGCCLFTIGALGGAAALVADSGAAADPAYSPDGRLVAFSYGRDIWVSSPGGSGRRQVTTGGNNDQDVAFSPDGRLVFRRASGVDDLWVINLDGSGLRNLTNDPGAFESQPSWSPDGRTIAYERGTSAGEGSIYAIGSDGSGRRSLTPEVAAPGTCEPDFFRASAEPSWSPDGSRIAFTGPNDVCPAGQPRYYGSEIWTMDSSGGGKTKLTANDGPSENEPHWSPDGSRIAFLSDAEEREGSDDLYTMAADGSGVRKLLDRGIKDEDIDWGPAPARIVPKRLTSKVTFVRTGRKTRVVASGKLVLPAGAAASCAGRVRVTVQRGARRLARRTVRLKGCRYRVTLRFRAAAGRVTVAPRYLGAGGIAPRAGRRAKLRLR